MRLRGTSYPLVVSGAAVAVSLVTPGFEVVEKIRPGESGKVGELVEEAAAAVTLGAMVFMR